MDASCATRWAQGEIPQKDDVQIMVGDDDFMVWIPQIKQEWLNSVKIVNGGLALKLFWQKGEQGKGCAPPFGGGYLTLYFPGDLRAQIRYGFERCVSRPASDAEIERLAKLYDVQQKLIGDTPESAEKITGKKEATAQQAALITLARVMLNLDEAITRE